MDSLTADPHELNHPTSSHCPLGAQPDPISSYPNAGQPVIDTTLKEMLIFIRSSLQADMLSFLRKFDHNLSVPENRVSNVEGNLGEVANTVNVLMHMITLRKSKNG